MLRIRERIRALWNLNKNEKGAIAPLVALMLVAIVGFTGLVVDGGMLYETRRQLQNGVDAAALAGAWELPEDTAAARAKAYEYAGRNGISSGEVTSVTVGHIYNPYDSIAVTATRRVNLTFMRALGLTSEDVGASATALVTPVMPEDLWPWGVPDTTYLDRPTTLKFDPKGKPAPGNFGPVDFSGHGGGGDEYKEAIMYDSPARPAVPYTPGMTGYSWPIWTETGNKTGPTMQGIDYLKGLSAPSSCQYDSPDFNPRLECPLIGIVPIVDNDSWPNGQSEKVTVIGFAAFYLYGYTYAEDEDEKKKGGGEKNGQLIVQGTFLDYAKVSGGQSIVGGGLQGLIGARLWR